MRMQTVLEHGTENNKEENKVTLTIILGQVADRGDSYTL